MPKEIKWGELIEEIEGIGKSECRELENRLAVLLRAHSQMVVLARSKKLQLGGYNQRITARSTPFTKLAYGCVCPNLAKRLILEEFISSRTNTHACMPANTFLPTFGQAGWEWKEILDTGFTLIDTISASGALLPRSTEYKTSLWRKKRKNDAC
jgi:hypothetical protein